MQDFRGSIYALGPLLLCSSLGIFSILDDLPIRRILPYFSPLSFYLLSLYLLLEL